MKIQLCNHCSSTEGKPFSSEAHTAGCYYSRKNKHLCGWLWALHSEDFHPYSTLSLRKTTDVIYPSSEISFFPSGHALGMWKFLGQELNLSHSNDSTGSLTTRSLWNSWNVSVLVSSRGPCTCSRMRVTLPRKSFVEDEETQEKSVFGNLVKK